MEHLISNTIPLIVLLFLLHFFYQNLFRKVLIGILLLSGIWVWIAARPNFHLGASAMVYGLCLFIFVSGILRKHALLTRISLLVVFLYGSMIWGIFPIYPNMSWEGHLFGALSGTILAFYYKKEGPQRNTYPWENEEDVDDPTQEKYWDISDDEKSLDSPDQT